MVVEVPAVHVDFYQAFRNAVMLFPVIKGFFYGNRISSFLFLQYGLSSRIEPLFKPDSELLSTLSRLS